MYKKITFILSSYYAIYIALATFVEPFTWFISDEYLERISPLAHVVLVSIPIITLIIYYFFYISEKNLLRRFLGVESVSSGKSRTDTFQDLRDKAKSHIIISGPGLTNLVQFDLYSLEKQAEAVSIDFLMIDPDFLEREKELSRQLERFLDVYLFTEQVRASFERLKVFCETWNSDDNHRYKMSLRVFETIPTKSMLMIDPDEDTGEIIIEFLLYQSGAYRPRLQIKKIDHQNSLFELIKNEHLKLWNGARKVV